MTDGLEPSPVCRSCGAERTGPYCARCGQRALERRHTLRSLIGGGVSRALGLEQGFLHTIARMTVAPGTVTRAYLEGSTKPYTHPAAYLVLSFAVFVLIGETVGGVQTGGDGSNRVLFALVVLFIALVSRMLVRSRNYAEHLITVMYLIGHVALIAAIGLLFTPLLPLTARSVIAVAVVLLCTSYFVWGYSASFGTRRLVSAAIGLVALVGGIVTWGAALLLIVQVFRR